MNFRSPKSRIDRTRRRSERLFGDRTHFLKTLLENPRLTGAAAPSSPYLAREMARAVGPARRGLIIERGPGTGPVAKALIEHRIAREQLALVEYDNGFCRPEQVIVQHSAPNAPNLDSRGEGRVLLRAPGVPAPPEE
jgi:phospholipid N-methyltransferase